MTHMHTETCHYTEAWYRWVFV